MDKVNVVEDNFLYLQWLMLSKMPLRHIFALLRLTKIKLSWAKQSGPGQVFFDDPTCFRYLPICLLWMGKD